MKSPVSESLTGLGGEDEIINLLVGNTYIVSKTISITALYADTLKLKIF